MGRKRQHESLYLDPDRLDLLNQLAAETRLAKQVLLREAVNDLLVKYRKLKRPKS